MFRPFLLALSLGLFSEAAYAQADKKTPPPDFDIRWEEKPQVHTVPDSFKKQSAVFVLLQRQMEYRAESGSVYVYRTIHHIIKPLDDPGLEAFNKFSIPIGANREITSIMARTIQPGGKVIELGRDKIRRTKNEEGQEEYLFAMEGVSKGAEVEVLYTEKRPMALFGTEHLQFNLPIVKAEFRLIAPERLRFETRGYNGFPAATDTLIGKFRIYESSAENISALEDEPYSNRNASLKKLAFRLSYIEGAGNDDVRQFTWNDLVRDMYSTYYEIRDKEKKVVNKYLSSIGVREDMSDAQKIRTIEEAMKSGISMSETLDGDDYEEFETILKKKVTTERGFAKLLIACLEQAGVDNELGLTTNRFEDPLDEQFEVWNALDLYVLYFPKLKTYMTPTAINYRYPFIPFAIRGNKAVFCKMTTLGKMKSAIAAVRTVPMLPMDQTKNDIDATIRFKGEDLEPQVDIVHSFQGYSAIGVREAFVFTTKDKEKELVSGLIDLDDKKENITEYKVENAAFSGYNDNLPLKLTASIRASRLLEKAGNRYLFKVGEVLGPQAEMYNDENRVLPIDMQYSHSLGRRIRIEIPEGYKITNPESVRVDVRHRNKEGREVMGFVSDYKMEGNALLITINEFYEEALLPVSDYTIFRKVINAAADFNKVVLVLQK